MGVQDLATEVASSFLSDHISALIVIILLLLNLIIQLLFFFLSKTSTEKMHNDNLSFQKNKNIIEKSIVVYEELYSKLITLNNQIFNDLISGKTNTKHKSVIQGIRLEKQIKELYLSNSLSRLIDDMLDYFSSILIDPTQKNDSKEISFLKNFTEEFKNIE
ncbi:hypothetical protein [Spirochaeta isovalerica]|uniref:Uncharacterized protein n=1 Tax=Spirochaeta isovalerica TaxID=150 RepID=A0A841RJ19_9SPIO|nr:hypothetical protein [Spirochaeta isovalerica]MBB6482709.1 hypothetical protein [Spirochaeta isovalerica]